MSYKQLISWFALCKSELVCDQRVLTNCNNNNNLILGKCVEVILHFFRGMIVGNMVMEGKFEKFKLVFLDNLRENIFFNA